VSASFIINGMHHALCTLGHADAYRPDLWQYEVVVNTQLKQASRRGRMQGSDQSTGKQAQCYMCRPCATGGAAFACE